ncbi:MAG: Uncharacterised protein [Methanobacteriota archaeon]|nr:MAG: Uncharacterised protein [Euryarchaeota archaeon]
MKNAVKSVAVAINPGICAAPVSLKRLPPRNHGILTFVSGIRILEFPRFGIMNMATKPISKTVSGAIATQKS